MGLRPAKAAERAAGDVGRIDGARIHPLVGALVGPRQASVALPRTLVEVQAYAPQSLVISICWATSLPSRVAPHLAWITIGWRL